MGIKNPWDARRQLLVSILRQMREAAGLKQSDVAEKLGTHQSFVSKYEAGERRLDLVELEQISDAIGSTLPSVVAAYWRARDESK